MHGSNVTYIAGEFDFVLMFMINIGVIIIWDCSPIYNHSKVSSILLAKMAKMTIFTYSQ